MPAAPDQPPLTPQRALFRLDGRVALVTGAAGHLGQAIATGLAEAGARTILVGRTEATLVAFAGELTGRGLAAETAICDVTQAAQIDALVARIGDALARLSDPASPIRTVVDPRLP
mgnify:CR=1 FL=1